LLSKGQAVFDGNTKDCIERYLETSSKTDYLDLATRTDREGSGVIRATSLRVTDENSEPLLLVKSGMDICLALDVTAEEEADIRSAEVYLTVYSSLDHFMFSCSNEYKPARFPSGKNLEKLTCVIPNLPLTAGNYYVNVFIRFRGEICDWVRQATKFSVEDGDYFGSGKVSRHRHGLLVDHRWIIRSD
jgi:lipopolysaccharide transport system ATP-binding protein